MRTAFSRHTSADAVAYDKITPMTPSLWDSTVCDPDWLRAARREEDRRETCSFVLERDVAKPLCSDCEDTGLDYHYDPLAGIACARCPSCEACGIELRLHEGYNEMWSSTDLLHSDEGHLVAPGPCAVDLFGGDQ